MPVWAGLGEREREAGQEGLLGDGLRSQEVTLQVPSALAGLTTGFGKGPGVPPPLLSPSNPSRPAD